MLLTWLLKPDKVTHLGFDIWWHLSRSVHSITFTIDSLEGNQHQWPSSRDLTSFHSHADQQVSTKILLKESSRVVVRWHSRVNTTADLRTRTLQLRFFFWELFFRFGRKSKLDFSDSSTEPWKVISYFVINLAVLRIDLQDASWDLQVFLLGFSNRFEYFFLFIAHMLSFIAISNTSGAKIIGSLGVLKHSLAILVLYLDTIDLWVKSNDKDTGVPTIVFTCKYLDRFSNEFLMSFGMFQWQQSFCWSASLWTSLTSFCHIDCLKSWKLWVWKVTSAAK